MGLCLFQCESKFSYRLTNELSKRCERVRSNNEFEYLEWDEVVKGFVWDSLAIIGGNESVPIESKEIFDKLGIYVDQVNVGEDKFIFKNTEGEYREYITSHSHYRNTINFTILPCDDVKIYSHWISKNDADFIVIPLRHNYAGLIPNCNPNYAIPDIQEYEDSLNVLGLFFDNVRLQWSESI